MIKALVMLSALVGSAALGPYVVAVLAPAMATSGVAATPRAAPVGGYALPVPVEIIEANPAVLTRPHHDYPA